MRIEIKGEVLHNVAQFTSSNSYCPAYNTLKMELKKYFTRLVATDGSSLCLFEENQNNDVRGEYILELNKTKFDKKALYSILFLEGFAVFENCRTHKQEVLKYFSGRYPDYMSVIPKRKTKAAQYTIINPDFLLRLKNCMPEEWSRVPFQEGENKPCLWLNEKYKVVIMPIKSLEN